MLFVVGHGTSARGSSTTLSTSETANVLVFFSCLLSVFILLLLRVLLLLLVPFCLILLFFAEFDRIEKDRREAFDGNNFLTKDSIVLR